MPVSSDFRPASNNGAATPTERPARELIRQGMYQLQLIGVSEKTDTVPARFNKSGKDEDILKLEFQFVVVTPGPFYGRFLWKNVTPTLSPGGEGSKESNLHALLKNLVNGGEDYTLPAIREFSKNFAARLNEIEAANPQVLAVVKVKNNRNYIDSFIAAEERLAEFRPPAQTVPDGDDPTVVCEGFDGASCGRVITSWTRSDGSTFTQADWVEHLETKYNGRYCGRCLKKVKNALPF